MVTGPFVFNKIFHIDDAQAPQSPIGHSPISCATPASTRMSLLITPILEVETENEAFSVRVDWNPFPWTLR